MSLFDCHCHTERSACAEDVTLQWYSQIAADASCYFAITDHSAHIYYPPDVKWSFWTEQGREVFDRNKQWGDLQLEQYIADVRAAQCGGMYLGLELDIFLDGTPVCDERYLGEFDVLLGAPHTFPAVQSDAPATQIEAQYKLIVKRLLALEVQVLAHPFRILVQKKHPVSDDLIKWTVDICGEHGVALEINSHSICEDEDLRMAEMACSQGAMLALGTDTHRKTEFGDFGYHHQVANAVGVSADRLYWQLEQVTAHAAE